MSDEEAWSKVEFAMETKVIASGKDYNTGTVIDTGQRSSVDKIVRSTSPVEGVALQLQTLAGGGIASGIVGGTGGLGSDVISGGGGLLKSILNGGANINSVISPTTAIGLAGSLPDNIEGVSSDSDSQVNSAVKNLLGGKKSSGTFNAVGGVIESENNPDSGNYVKLAQSVFTSGTTAEGATVDIYDSVDLNSPQNKIKSILGDVLGIANKTALSSIKDTLLKLADTSSLSAGALSLNGAKNVLNSYKNTILSGVPLNKSLLEKELFSALGYDGKSLEFKGGLKGIGEQMISEITKNIDEQTGLHNIYKQTKEILSGDADFAQSLFKIVDNFTGNSELAKYLNMADEFKIIRTVADSLIQLGAIDKLNDLVEKIDHKDRSRYIEEMMDAGLNSGDLDFLEFALKYTSGAKILASRPDAISLIVTAYTPQADSEDNVSSTEYSRLLNILGRLDSNWDNLGYSSGVKIMNYEIFAKFNSQGKLAVAASGNRQHMAALIAAENFRGDTDIIQALQQRFPYYPLT